MVRLIFWGLLAYGVWKMIQRLFRLYVRSRQIHFKAHPEIDDVLVEDPVCGARVPRQKALVHRSWGKTTYYCSHECLEKSQRHRAKG